VFLTGVYVCERASRRHIFRRCTRIGLHCVASGGDRADIRRGLSALLMQGHRVLEVKLREPRENFTVADDAANIHFQDCRDNRKDQLPGRRAHVDAET
jgi:hypothetical protein